jgi:hypothetical protein
MGKAYGIKGGAIGNMLRKIMGTHCVLDGNIMRTCPGASLWPTF